MKKATARAKSTKRAASRASLSATTSMPEPFRIVRKDVIGELLRDPDWAVENMRRLVAYYSTHDEYGEKLVASTFF